jgi:D-amino peptidase
VNPNTKARCALVPALAAALVLAAATSGFAQGAKAKKVFMITDMEGVDGIFNWEDQCDPFKSPRWKESQKFLTDEVNAATEGLIQGGATDVVVADLHDASRSLSVADLQPKARLLQGHGFPPMLGLDASYSAVIFIGQHAMAGAENGVLSHSYAFEIQNIWVNAKATGEIGARTLLAGYFGIPVIMLAGDTAACKEIHDLVPEAECAEVKSGVTRTAGFGPPHDAACLLIRQKAQRAMERLGEFKPYQITGPVEVKVEYTTNNVPILRPREGVERVNERTYLFRGKDLVDSWLKFDDF